MSRAASEYVTLRAVDVDCNHPKACETVGKLLSGGIVIKRFSMLRDSRGRVLVRRDWRQAAAAWARAIFPGCWCYFGGSHVAIHASAPLPMPHTNRLVSDSIRRERAEAGRCLLRIVEARS